jgi:hypothetical protein
MSNPASGVLASTRKQNYIAWSGTGEELDALNEVGASLRIAAMSRAGAYFPHL